MTDAPSRPGPVAVAIMLRPLQSGEREAQVPAGGSGMPLGVIHAGEPLVVEPVTVRASTSTVGTAGGTTLRAPTVKTRPSGVIAAAIAISDCGKAGAKPHTSLVGEYTNN